MSNKQNKKIKRGVKTSYGNYAQCGPIHFGAPNNKLKLHKARKSLMTTHG